jgi:hypothetical protein
MAESDSIEVRLLVPAPPQPPALPPTRGELHAFAAIDLTLEEAAVAREQALLASRARSHWPEEDEALAIAQSLSEAQLSCEAACAEAEQTAHLTAVQGWVERGYDADDSFAAVSVCGSDAAACLAFFAARENLESFGFSRRLAREALTATKGDMQAAVIHCLNSS